MDGLEKVDGAVLLQAALGDDHPGGGPHILLKLVGTLVPVPYLILLASCGRARFQNILVSVPVP